MSCVFCNIAQGQIPATVVFENEDVMAFRDLNPQAPTHALVIPKRHISTINDVNEQDAALLGKMVLAAKTVASTEGFHEAGYRLVFNVNSDGGQTVYHIHLHILGGRPMTWPPG
jgi:histidine triad (HIT) family protein